MNITLCGAASDNIDNVYKKKVGELGREMGRRGHTMVFGAGSTGLMGAAARGFKENGGKVHGVIPYFFEENGYEAIFKGCDELTRTETMAERKRVMEDAADAFIIVPGGIGTLEEFFEVLTLKQLGRHKKAIALYNSCGFYTHFDKSLDEIISQKFVNEECKMLYKTVNSEKEVIEYIENYTADGLNWDFLKRN